MNLAVRLTRSAFMLEDFFKRLDNVCDSTIWFEHPQDHKVARTHCHGLIMGCKVSVETLKNWLRIESVKWDRNMWSFKEKYKVNGVVHDVNLNFIIYMSKGKYDPSYNKNVSNWRQFKDAWIEKSYIQSDIRDQMDSERQQEQKTRWEMLQEVKRRIELFTYEVPPAIIVETIIDVFKHNKVIISRYKVRDMYDSFMAYEKKGAFISDIINMCVKV